MCFHLTCFHLIFLSGKCGTAYSALCTTLQSSSSSCSMDLMHNTIDPDEVVDCLASACPDTLGPSFSSSCQLKTDEIVCNHCDCSNEEQQNCQRTCILPFNNSGTYVVLTGLSANGPETTALLQQMANSYCLETIPKFEDCSCDQTPTPSPLETGNSKFTCHHSSNVKLYRSFLGPL